MTGRSAGNPLAPLDGARRVVEPDQRLSQPANERRKKTPHVADHTPPGVRGSMARTTSAATYNSRPRFASRVFCRARRGRNDSEQAACGAGVERVDGAGRRLRGHHDVGRGDPGAAARRSRRMHRLRARSRPGVERATAQGRSLFPRHVCGGLDGQHVVEGVEAASAGPQRGPWPSRIRASRSCMCRRLRRARSASEPWCSGCTASPSRWKQRPRGCPTGRAASRPRRPRPRRRPRPNRKRTTSEATPTANVVVARAGRNDGERLRRRSRQRDRQPPRGVPDFDVRLRPRQHGPALRAA